MERQAYFWAEGNSQRGGRKERERIKWGLDIKNTRSSSALKKGPFQAEWREDAGRMLIKL